MPTSAGSTGMIRPIEIMSISTVAMMNGIAAWRLPEAVRRVDDGDGSALTVVGVIEVVFASTVECGRSFERV